MKARIFRFLNLLWVIKYNLTIKRFKPGNIVYLDGLPTVKYLVLKTDYHITQDSSVFVQNLNDGRRNWYVVSWFRIWDLAELSKFERLLYSVE